MLLPFILGAIIAYLIDPIVERLDRVQNLKRPAAAEKAFREGLGIEPDSEALLYALAVLYIQQEEKGKARPIVNRLLQINPQNGDYRNLLGAIQ